MESASGGAEKKSYFKNKKFWTYAGVVALILAAVIISLLFYKQKIEVLKFEKLTENWQTFESGKYHLSFKYPKNWVLTDYSGPNTPKEDPTVMYVIKDKDENYKNTIDIRINNSRLIGHENPENAIQISIPFDKQNYLIFSTSTNNEAKEIFYNIPVTLVIGE